MLYLLDANVLIAAKNSYYAFDRVPEFWEWLGGEPRQREIAGRDLRRDQGRQRRFGRMGKEPNKQGGAPARRGSRSSGGRACN